MNGLLISFHVFFLSFGVFFIFLMFKSSLSLLEYQTSMIILLTTFPVFHRPYNILPMFFSIESSQIYIFKLVKFFLVVFPFTLCLESLSLPDSHIYMYTHTDTHRHTHIYIPILYASPFYYYFKI